MRNYMAAGWFYSPSQIGHYFATRITSLKPPKGARVQSPWKTLAMLDRHQWLMFLAGFLGWTWDAFDFFTVSLTVTELAVQFDCEPAAVTWGITITLMLRFFGALTFGTLSDRYGRKWVMIINLCAFIVLELATGFCNTKSQFLGVRALYGIAMGGLYGPAAATALEDLPYEARGILSGLYQQAYAVGYILASVFYRALVPTTSHGWRSLYWFGAAPPVLIIAYRLCLPETNHFQVMKAEREARHAADQEAKGHADKTGALRAFVRESLAALRKNWVLFVYMVVLMTGFNSISHGSQDLYPTFLKNQVYASATEVTVVSVVGQIGALIGAMTIGWISTITGRRLIMMACCVVGGAIIPAYIVPRNMSLTASAFFQQFFVGGVWGPIPVHLIELSPPALRSLMVGLTYQLGNLASSAASTIEATIGQRFPLAPLHTKTGITKRYDYGKVIAIFMGAVFAYILLFVFLGPEMTQEERDEEAVTAARYEELRKQGVSLIEIGQGRAKEMNVEADGSVSYNEKAAEKAHVEYVEPPTV